MRPELVLFDCDGVLVDSEGIVNEIVVGNLSRHGLQLSSEECMELFVGTSDDYMKTTAEEMGACLPPDWLEQLDFEIFARLNQGVLAIDGVEAILDRLEDLKIPFCVVSNGSEDKMALTLGQTGLGPRFEGAIFSAHTLNVFKPDPGLFLHAANVFNISTDDCVVIEDSPSGAKAAYQAGMKCYGYTPHNDGSKLSAEGAQVFHCMKELAGLLGIE